MTTRVLSRKTPKTTRKAGYVRGSKPKAALSVPATPKPAAPEPTFTLAEFSRLMGENYSLGGGKGDPLTVALNVIDDLRRVLFAVANLAGPSDAEGIEELVTNAWARSQASLAVLTKFGRHGSKAEVL
jgi:hypothetical protein